MKTLNTYINESLSVSNYINICKKYNELGGFSRSNIPYIPRGMDPDDYYKQKYEEEQSHKAYQESGKENRKKHIEEINKKIDIKKFQKTLDDIGDKYRNKVQEIYNDPRKKEDRHEFLKDLRKDCGELIIKTAGEEFKLDWYDLQWAISSVIDENPDDKDRYVGLLNFCEIALGLLRNE